MTESEGVYVQKATKPKTNEQIGDWEVISGTAAGRDVYLIRHDVTAKSIDITRHKDEGERRPPYMDERGKYELVYNGLLHHNPISTGNPASHQSREHAEQIAKTIKCKGENS